MDNGHSSAAPAKREGNAADHEHNTSKRFRRDQRNANPTAGHKGIFEASKKPAVSAVGLLSKDPVKEESNVTQNVLITGGAGFIASCLVRKLVTKYPAWNICVVDKLEYCASLRSLEGLEQEPNFEFVKGDITSADFMVFLMKTKSIDTVVHLAAQTHVDNSFGNSFEFTLNNVVGTHVLLEAARVHPIKRFIHVSTDEVYGDVPLGSPSAHEESILSPTNPYSATKAAAECMVRAYHRSFGVPVIITRSNNVFGPRQYPEKIIPKFICLLLQGEKCPIHGQGTNTRRYIYVMDVCDALDLVIQRGEIGEIYNVGTDFEINNLALAKLLVKKVVGKAEDSQEHMLHVEDRALNDMRYAIDSTKMLNLGWRPMVSFDKGIDLTIEWYRKNALEWWDDIQLALKAHPPSRHHSSNLHA